MFYVGGSLGGIMGNTFMAYDPNITRGVLAVPGGVWSLLIERSFAWHAADGRRAGRYEDPEVYQLNIALFGMGFEPYRSDHDRRARHQGSAAGRAGEEHPHLVRARRLARVEHLDGDGRAHDGHRSARAVR